MGDRTAQASPRQNAGTPARNNEQGASRELLTPEVSPLNDFLDVMYAVQEIANNPRATADEKKICAEQIRQFRNCCGQYAVATVCQSLGRPVAIRDVIQQTNPCGMGTGSKDIIDFLKSKGIAATACEKGTVESLRQHVEAGGLAIVLVNADSDPKKFAPHWIVVGKDSELPAPPNTNQEYCFKISDAANLSGSIDAVGTITSSALATAWEKPFGRLSGTVLPQDHYWIAVDKNPVGQDRRIVTKVSDASLELLDTLVEAPGNTLRESRELLGSIRNKIQFKHRDPGSKEALSFPKLLR